MLTVCHGTNSTSGIRTNTVIEYIWRHPALQDSVHKITYTFHTDMNLASMNFEYSNIRSSVELQVRSRKSAHCCDGNTTHGANWLNSRELAYVIEGVTAMHI